MDNRERLRDELISYIKKKFYSRSNIITMADEIVNQTFLDVTKSSGFDGTQLNFGYIIQN